MKAVILAGGLGTRLHPLTQAIPKPLLPIGEHSLLEIQVTHLRDHGFDEIYIATNYKSHYIENFLGDGSQHNIKIHISKENKPLGTCGPLKLIEESLTEPFLVMNGDILTTANFSKIYETALDASSLFSVVTKEIIFPFEFGNVISENGFVKEIREKPSMSVEIIAGIYVMDPKLFSLIPKDTYFGMDNLLQDLIKRKEPISTYMLTDYWLDIGRVEDYNKAEAAYRTHFKNMHDEFSGQEANR